MSVIHVTPPVLDEHLLKLYPEYLRCIHLLKDALGPNTRLALGKPHQVDKSHLHGQRERHHVETQRPHLTEAQKEVRKLRNQRRRESRSLKRATARANGAKKHVEASHPAQAVTSHGVREEKIAHHELNGAIEKIRHEEVTNPTRPKALRFTHRGLIYHLTGANNYSTIRDGKHHFLDVPPRDAEDIVHKRKKQKVVNGRPGSHSETEASDSSLKSDSSHRNTLHVHVPLAEPQKKVTGYTPVKPGAPILFSVPRRERH